jgi:hypothetical protein
MKRSPASHNRVRNKPHESHAEAAARRAITESLRRDAEEVRRDGDTCAHIGQRACCMLYFEPFK